MLGCFHIKNHKIFNSARTKLGSYRVLVVTHIFAPCVLDERVSQKQTAS